MHSPISVLYRKKERKYPSINKLSGLYTKLCAYLLNNTMSQTKIMSIRRTSITQLFVNVFPFN